MATVIFYEKPGCATNTRQKRLLVDSGHTVDARSLLAEPWSAERLTAFFEGIAVPGWFNLASPRVKSGEIDPQKIEAAAALGLMLADPLLIRRPLIEAEGQKICGFNVERLRATIGLRDLIDSRTTLEGCAHPHRSAPCPEPRRAGTAE